MFRTESTHHIIQSKIYPISINKPVQLLKRYTAQSQFNLQFSLFYINISLPKILCEVIKTCKANSRYIKKLTKVKHFRDT